VLVGVVSPWSECHPLPLFAPIHGTRRPALYAALFAYPWRAHGQRRDSMPRVVGRWPCAVRAVSRMWCTWWMV